MKFQDNQVTGVFNEEIQGIINQIKKDINQYKQQLEDYYNGDDSIIDCETRVYYERELIPRLEADIKYYESYYLYE